MPDEIFGPSGLLVAALAVVAVLWRDHLRADADDRTQRDRALGLVDQLTGGLAKLSDAWEQRNREDASRRRQDDR